MTINLQEHEAKITIFKLSKSYTSSRQSYLRLLFNMAKRSLQFDEYDVSDIVQSKKAKVHGVVTQLSPVKFAKKSNRQYFEGHLTDGKKSVRIVSFSPQLRNAMDSALTEQSSIAVVNCNIDFKQSEGTIFLNEKSTIQPSPKKFFISDVASQSIKQITEICDLPSLATGNFISAKVKVLSLSAPENVKNREKSFLKQDCVIADSSACCRLVYGKKI